jgi:hypothetical protein
MPGSKKGHQLDSSAVSQTKDEEARELERDETAFRACSSAPRFGSSAFPGICWFLVYLALHDLAAARS